MFKTIGFKVSIAVFGVLLVSFVAIQFILTLDFRNTADKMSRDNLDMISASVFQTMRMAMNLGDRDKIHEAIEAAEKIKGISSIKVYPSKDTIELFDMKDATISNDKLIIEQFSKPEFKSLEEQIDGIDHLRLIRPLVADESCLACHATEKVGNVVGVMEVYHSLEDIENDIARTSRSYIIIFTLALVFTLVVVLSVLKIVIGNPIEELLRRARELAKGSGNLKARISVKGRDEIANACDYINQFIEKTQNTVNSVTVSSKNVESQTDLLNTSATSLNEVTKESHQKIDESFKLSANISDELRELASLSSDANDANNKSYHLLDQMLGSLFGVADKISSIAENENTLAKKVENMMQQANNIQKATEMIGEIADKTNLLSLNAGIEAARAGTYGRGFSVIAEDVRNLAQSSDEFLANVVKIVKELLASISEVSKDLKSNAENVNSLNTSTTSLVDHANEVKICNQNAKNLVMQCSQKIKSSQENIQNLLMCMEENVEVSEKNEQISKVLLQIVDELKIVCHSLEGELSKFEV